MEGNEKNSIYPTEFTWKRACKIYWGIVREKSIVWWCTKIAFWIFGAAIGLEISIWLKWEDVVSTVLLQVIPKPSEGG